MGETKPKRIQRKRTKGWKMPPNTVYVGRPTMGGNPFKVVRAVFIPTTAHPDNGEQWNVLDTNECRFWAFTTKIEALQAAVNLFRTTANDPSDSADLWRKRIKFWLKDQDLACFCPLDQPCHADVLLELANGD